MADNTDILKAIEAMRADVQTRLDHQVSATQQLASQVLTIGKRVDGFETRLHRLEEDHVMAKRVSQDNDETQSAALTAAMHIHGKHLASLRAETDSKLAAQDKVLAQQTSMLLDQTKALADISKALGHPMVRRIAWLVGAAILAWLSSKGFK